MRRVKNNRSRWVECCLCLGPEPWPEQKHRLDSTACLGAYHTGPRPTCPAILGLWPLLPPCSPLNAELVLNAHSVSLLLLKTCLYLPKPASGRVGFISVCRSPLDWPLEATFNKHINTTVLSPCPPREGSPHSVSTPSLLRSGGSLPCLHVHITRSQIRRSAFSAALEPVVLAFRGSNWHMLEQGSEWSVEAFSVTLAHSSCSVLCCWAAIQQYQSLAWRCF